MSRRKVQVRRTPLFIERSGGSPSRAWIRAVAIGTCLAVALYLVHHQLQIVYFRTCKANLLTIVLHHRSDVCYALNMAISAIERGYQQGLMTLMQCGASAAAVLLPYVFSGSPSRSATNKRSESSRDGSHPSGHEVGISSAGLPRQGHAVKPRASRRRWWPSWIGDQILSEQSLP